MKTVKIFTILALAFTLLSPIGCGAGNDQSGQTSASSTKDRNIVSRIDQAKKIITDYKLTDIPFECLKFESVGHLQEFNAIIDVREIHSKTCGGDAQTSPRLFTIAFSKDGHIWSDANSLLGQLEPLD